MKIRYESWAPGEDARAEGGALAVAWAAGVVDGEGCITISKQRAGSGGRITDSHRLYLKVTMGHRATVERLRNIFGVGAVTIQKSTRWNDAYTWWVSSRQAGGVITALRPHLVAKAVEADLAVAFLSLPSGLTGGRGGNRALPADLVAQRELLFERMRDAKPSARFRTPAAASRGGAV